MTLSKRGKATILGVLAFVAALAIYLATRPEGTTAASKRLLPADVEAANAGRSIGRRLAALASKGGETASAPSHAMGPVCDSCTVENCPAGTDDGCDSITDPGDRKLCEDLFACFQDPKNRCVVQGDALRCWCGDNMTTCVSANSGPTQANGPCVKQVFAAARTSDADTIFHKFLDAELPLGRAARLALCRGSFCSADCKIP